jgi:hypothetical protein
LAAKFLGKMDPERALLSQISPKRRELIRRCIQGGPGYVGRATRLDPPPEGDPKLLVLITDSDRHAQFLAS